MRIRDERRYPFDAQPMTFYRARNAIYYLFEALKQPNNRLTVLVPDYNSGNEVLALEQRARPCAITRSAQMARWIWLKSNTSARFISLMFST